MSGIRGRNTRIEVAVRKALFARGFRYRLNDKSLPGKPDMVFPRYRALVFVHGCYWHGHDCTLFRLPIPSELAMCPTANGNYNGMGLNPQFVEWLMGWPMNWTKT